MKQVQEMLSSQPYHSIAYNVSTRCLYLKRNLQTFAFFKGLQLLGARTFRNKNRNTLMILRKYRTKLLLLVFISFVTSIDWTVILYVLHSPRGRRPCRSVGLQTTYKKQFPIDLSSIRNMSATLLEPRTFIVVLYFCMLHFI